MSVLLTGDNIESLIQRADKYMYRAKSEGRNRKLRGSAEQQPDTDVRGGIRGGLERSGLYPLRFVDARISHAHVPSCHALLGLLSTTPPPSRRRSSP